MTGAVPLSGAKVLVNNSAAATAATVASTALTASGEYASGDLQTAVIKLNATIAEFNKLVADVETLRSTQNTGILAGLRRKGLFKGS